MRERGSENSDKYARLSSHRCKNLWNLPNVWYQSECEWDTSPIGPHPKTTFSRHSRNHSDQGWRKCLMQSPNVYIEFPHLHDDWYLFILHFSIAKNTYNLRRLFMASPSPHRYQPRGRCCFSVCRSAIISSDQLGARDVWSAWDAEKMLQKLNLKVMKIVSVCSAIDDITSHGEWKLNYRPIAIEIYSFQSRALDGKSSIQRTFISNENFHRLCVLFVSLVWRRLFKCKLKFVPCCGFNCWIATNFSLFINDQSIFMLIVSDVKHDKLQTRHWNRVEGRINKWARARTNCRESIRFP